MDFNDEYLKSESSISRDSSNRQSPPFLTPENTVAIFTTLSILLKMKSQLGLEAMMEYMEFYISTIERHNPRFKGAVERALALMNVRRIHDSMCPPWRPDKDPGPLEGTL